MKHRRRFSRRAKPTVRWFGAEFGYDDRGNATTLSTGSFAASSVILAMHQRNPVPGANLVENVQKHRIEAIRGYIVLQGGRNVEPDATPAFCVYRGGIRIVDLDSSGSIPNFNTPFAPAQSDDDWMWLHSAIVTPGGEYVLGASGDPWVPTPHPSQVFEVHVKTRRIMTDNQALVLYEQTALPNGGGGTDVINFSSHWLRTLISHPE